MTRPTFTAPLPCSLIAATAGAALALSMTSGAQAQALSDGGPSDSGLFDTVFNYPAQPNPAFPGDFGDATGAQLTQVNVTDNTALLGMGQRTYYYTELNVSGITANVGAQANFVNSEINLSAGGELGFMFTYDANTTLNMTGGTTGTTQTINGTANVSGGLLGQGTDIFGVLNLSGTATTGTTMEGKAGSITNMTGGTLGGSSTWQSGSTINISGGSIAFGFNSSGEVNMSGGSTGYGFDINSGSVMTMTGGTIAGDFDVNTGAVADVSGGDLGYRGDVKDGGILNMSGGSFGNDFDVEAGGTVNFFGTSFLVDGNAIAGLNSIGDTVTITARDVTLTGSLADGSAIELLMNSVNTSGNNATSDYVDSAGTVTVTLVPEPGSLALLGLGGLALLRRRR